MPASHADVTSRAAMRAQAVGSLMGALPTCKVCACANSSYHLWTTSATMQAYPYCVFQKHQAPASSCIQGLAVNR
ncbi:hypothetical protein Micbo1qcDRAFT_18756 [Microdochium bolleyi]|uniref:Uncharacterized protein n=1 Tax=Microdochium bolleyi TaxID=196109 RepID=A0A136IT66_9PEZI|nr:hypothetical protein Micbo1qcDRAFT_18756 [Microdochium bolleyi]